MVSKSLGIKKITYVVFSMSYYAHFERGVVNRNFFLFNALKKRRIVSSVVHIDFLPYSFKSFLRSLKYTYELQKRHRVIYSHLLFYAFRIDEMTVVVAAPIYYFSKGFFRGLLKRMLLSLRIKSPCSLSFNPLDTVFLDNRIFSLKHFDAVDDWRYHSQLKRKMRVLEKNYNTIVSLADTITVVSKQLTELFDNRAVLVPNGIDSSIIDTHNRSSKENAVVYLGTIEERFDIELMEYLVTSMPDVTFFCIGPVWRSLNKKIRSLQRYPSIYFLGRKPYNKSLTLISKFGVGILPHKISQFSTSNDPMKIYDYVAKGLTVVSTIPCQEQSIAKNVIVATTKESFKSSLTEALQGKIARAREHDLTRISWDRRLDTMLS